MLQHLSKGSLAVLLLIYRPNKVWQDGVFPGAWSLEAFMTSLIEPLLKSGKPKHKVSYRPVSLTCVTVCPWKDKDNGKMVTNRLSCYVEKNNLLTKVQTGFRKEKGTVNQLIRLPVLAYCCCFIDSVGLTSGGFRGGGGRPPPGSESGPKWAPLGPLE